MTTIKSTSARGASFVAAYNRSTARRLSDVYGSYSDDKARAEKNCLAWCIEEDGTGFKIISWCCNFFTAAWKTADGLRVETWANSYLVV